MKKTTRNILIMLAVLLVLGGIVAVLLLVPVKSDEDTSSTDASVSSAATETVMDREASEVEKISIKNSEGEFTFKAVGEEFTLEGYEDCTLNDSVVTYSAGTLLSMNATKNLGTQDGLAGFGLAGERAVTAEIKYLDGSSDTLVLGDSAPESSGRYVLKDNTVYIVSGINEMLYGSVFGYFNTTLYTVNDRTEQVTDEEGNTTNQSVDDILYHIRLSGTNFPDPIEVQYVSGAISSYIISSPIKAESGSDYYTSIAAALKAPTATGVAAVHLNDEILAQFGLLEPHATVEFDLNNTEHTMSVSAKNSDGTRYMLLDDRDVIYTVDNDTVSTWADCTLTNIRTSYVWLVNIMDVENLELTVDGDEVYSFDVTKIVNEEKSTESNTVYTLSVKNAAGEDIEYKTCYQAFYKKLLAVSVVSSDKTEYSETPALRAKYSLFDGGECTIEFYPAGDSRYAAVVDGEFNSLVRKSEVDKLIELAPQLNANADLSE